MGETITYFSKYTPAPDILVIAICFVFIILCQTAYISKTRLFRYLYLMIFFLAGAASSDIISNMLMKRLDVVPDVAVYVLRGLYHMGIYTVLFLYVLYVKESLKLKKSSDKRYYIVASVGYFAGFGLIIVESIFKIGFYIDEKNVIHFGFSFFQIIYIFFISLTFEMVFRYKKRLVKQIYVGIVETVFMSLLVMVIQLINEQASYTASTLLFPIFALLYLVHANPYNFEIGTVGENAFTERIALSKEKNEDLYFMCIYIKGLEGGVKNASNEVLSTIRSYAEKFFKNGVTYSISGGILVFTIDKKINPNYSAESIRMLSTFKTDYDRFRIDYKIVYSDNNEILSAENNYIEYLAFLFDRLEDNEILIANDKQVEEFLRYRYIISQLEDIQKKEDINDPRVKVYCQPVLSIKSGKYETAEALMRLELEDIGMVYPDEFIPEAEKYGTIKSLTKIILHKVCDNIKVLNDEGYKVKRISVNFSMYDVTDEEICTVVNKIIEESGIAFEQIAIEITETQSESDFVLIKKIIDELKGSGIKFYLDDFGTGYSNFERIMDLPFDIIKFDRSLVLASGGSEKYQTMVSNLANLFKDARYKILFEGIEDDQDEERCVKMNANYLQGYKYSKPIPMEELTSYFEKTV